MLQSNTKFQARTKSGKIIQVLFKHAESPVKEETSFKHAVGKVGHPKVFTGLWEIGRNRKGYVGLG